MTFPGSRVFQGWWRELASLSPRRLWFAHLLLHRVEALVEVTASRPLAALSRALLAQLGRHPPCSPEQLATHLALDRPLLARLLEELRDAGLACPLQEQAGSSEVSRDVGFPPDSPSPDSSPHPSDLRTLPWQVTPTGLEALAAGQPPPGGSSPIGATERSRRPFYFVDALPPIFVPLVQAATTALMPPAGWSFDLSVLEACIRQSPQWKDACGFPPDVLRLLPPPALSADVGEIEESGWRHVALDQAEQVLLMLIERQGEMLGLPVQADGWTLGREPIMTLRATAVWFDVLSPALNRPGGDAWRAAWQVWCQQRSLPAGEVDACQLDLDGHRLRVRAPGRLVERLRNQRSDAVKGEAWLVAGADRVRGVARVELESL